MFKKQLKNIKLWDLALTKLAVVSFALFVLGVWPVARDFVLNINPVYFLIISLISVAIVQFRVWKKS